MMRRHDMSDRKAKPQDPVHFLGQKLHGPVRQKLLPRDDLRVKQLTILVSRSLDCRLQPYPACFLKSYLDMTFRTEPCDGSALHCI